MIKNNRTAVSDMSTRLIHYIYIVLSRRVVPVSALLMTLLVLASCGSSKQVTGGTTSPDAITSATVNANVEAAYNARKTAFLQKVSDNAVYARNISAKVDVTLSTSDKEITLPGALKMRKDTVIRIQITPMGLMEVGRIEFTPDSVLVVNRMGKEYLKAAYNELDFLERNGIDFYTLQSLFWNELFLPGEQRVKESMLAQFDADIDCGKSTVPVSYSRNKLSYVWNADASTGQIGSVDVTYTSDGRVKGTLSCSYDDFTAVGVKMFPASIVLNMSAGEGKERHEGGISLKLKGIDTGADWDAYTSLSGKYKRVTGQDVFEKLLR